MAVFPQFLINMKIILNRDVSPACFACDSREEGVNAILWIFLSSSRSFRYQLREEIVDVILFLEICIYSTSSSRNLYDTQERKYNVWVLKEGDTTDLW